MNNSELNWKADLSDRELEAWVVGELEGTNPGDVPVWLDSPLTPEDLNCALPL